MLRVAICDDDAPFRALVRAVLTDADMEVVGESCDGVACLADLGRLRPDALLLDLSMPRADGHDVLRGIAEASPETKVVVLSGEPAAEAAAAVRALGAADFVAKSDPALIDVLPGRVRAAARAA